MKKVGLWLNVVLDLALIGGIVVQIIRGQASPIDYIILVGLFTIEIPAFYLRKQRKEQQSKHEETSNDEGKSPS